MRLVCEECKKEIRKKLSELREKQLKRSERYMGAFEAGIIVGFLNNVNKLLTGEKIKEE